MANLGREVRTVIMSYVGVTAAAANTAGKYSWGKQEIS